MHEKHSIYNQSGSRFLRENGMYPTMTTATEIAVTTIAIGKGVPSAKRPKIWVDRAAANS